MMNLDAAELIIRQIYQNRNPKSNIKL